jgi:rhodanese-related sulfurtransferase
MIDALKKLFGAGPTVDLGEKLKEGAIIIDVRSKGEFQSGHLKSSKNIPLDQLSSHLSKLDKNKAIITCCASGMRSGSAKGLLKSNGFEDVHNGGSWSSLKKYGA